MRGILPEEVRTRRGWVRADVLRAATEQARQGEVRNLPLLLCALSLETWLAVRAGRWAEPARRP